MTGTGSKAALAVSTAASLPIGAAYTQVEIVALRDYVNTLSARLKALDDALRVSTGHGLIG